MASRRSLKPSNFTRSPRPSFPHATSYSPQGSSRSQQDSYHTSPSQQSDGSLASDDFNTSQPQLLADAPRLSRSRPIPIELPPRQASATDYTPTPPEPLSARGDLPGGYFPLHEDFSRSYKPHPFHHDVGKAGRTAAMMQEPESPLLRPQSKSRQAFTETLRSSSPTMEALTMSMPLGKYHPSNYKNKVEVAAAPTNSSQPLHARQESDIRKKLQQYQRDMVEQAAIMGRLQFTGAKPENPRLVPLGSPGPVTPMELEESDGYLVAGMGGTPGEGSQQEMVGRMIRAEQERMQREGRGSPVGTVGGR